MYLAFYGSSLGGLSIYRSVDIRGMITSLLSILEFVGFCLTSLTCCRHRSQSPFVFLFLGCGLLVPVLKSVHNILELIEIDLCN